MCFERKVREVRNGKFADTGEMALVIKPAVKPPVHEDGFYVGELSALTGPFPSRGSAESHAASVGR